MALDSFIRFNDSGIDVRNVTLEGFAADLYDCSEIIFFGNGGKCA